MKSLILTTIINGWPIPSGQYPEVLSIRSVEGRQFQDCTAVAINKDEVMTAAHCVMGESPIIFGSNYAYCKNHKSLDLAICAVNVPLKPPYSKLTSKGPKIGEYITLTGAGCTSPERWPDGRIRYGYAPVTSLGGEYILTESDTALCFGDSGGPAFRKGTHELLGINSRGDVRTRSLMVKTYTPEVLNWIRNY